ncbi:flagellar biosynthesis protein FlgA [Microbispora sp. RL4-1S]|uniref:Flagellar biosynthesis protein FlgA n=1 Tax=Microbispora oryzae TaxID=2806554 RepID=A0A940WGT9_9ACTN|nr:SAF domain-containing protein [Microbispora oryzae]MBP2705424.1 flagellar biosynthesis protein FlgA [Microbispora oryzae]
MRAANRILARHRRPIAAILAGLGVACALLSVRPPAGVAVLAAARDLAGGRLSARDVTVVRLPPDSVPDGALHPGYPVAGRVAAGPMRRGEPITDVRLLGGESLTAQGPGLVATPVRIADPDAARLLSAGDVIDVLASFESEPRPAYPVAREVRVMTRVATRPSTGAEDAGALLVLATTSDQAAQLAQAQSQGRLSVAIHPR